MRTRNIKRLKRLGFLLLGLLLGVVGIPTMLGCCVFSGPVYEGPKSDHFNGERFFNPNGSFDDRQGGFWKWVLNREKGPWPEWIESEPGPPPPERVGQGDLRVTFVNHATVLLQTDGINILTDPIWSKRCSPVSWAGPRRVRDPGIRFEDLPPIDAVLLSHNHYDHLDVPTLRRLAESYHPRIFCGLGVTALLEDKGIPGGTDLDWWDETDLSNTVRITFLPCQHWSNRGTCDRFGTLWGSYAITSSAGNVYFAGDTGFGEHFQKAADAFGSFRLAILPIGAYLPRWFMGPAHISPEEAVRAHQILNADHSIPIHYGTFQIADDAYDQPLTELRRALDAEQIPESEFWILDFGEGRNVPHAPEHTIAE
jgi:L-ascorbate metabolism protein UlaG (beta-lactamase superfamily)